MRIAWIVVALVAGCRLTETVPDDYPNFCQAASDCVPVWIGDMCTPCACPNAVIARSALDEWQDDAQAAEAWCGDALEVRCGPCAPVVAECTSGVCALHRDP